MDKNLWKFGTREVVYSAIGAALYGVLSYATNVLALPAAGNISLRPAVAIPMFFGVVWGPIVGFLSGFVGNWIGDGITGWGFYWNWCVGNGLMGLVPGLIAAGITSYKAQSTLIKAAIYSVLGAAVGMLFAAVTEKYISGLDWSTAIVGYFVPAFLSDAINGAILVPILMVAYDAVVSRSGR